MRLEWTPDARDDLCGIKAYIHADNPQAAQKVAARLMRSALTLRQHPNKGRMGQVFGTRELVISDLPYLLVYRSGQDWVEILRVIHTARQWSSL